MVALLQRMRVCGPDMPEELITEWRPVLEQLQYLGTARAVINRGWDLAWEREQLAVSRDEGRDLISVRLSDDELLIGPKWVTGGGTSCAGCAEYRQRMVSHHPLASDLLSRRGEPAVRSPFLLELLAAAIGGLQQRPLAPGELLSVGVNGMRRHVVRRSFSCPLCRPPQAPLDKADRPDARVIPGVPQDPNDLARGLGGRQLEAPGWLRGQLVDPRFGPIRDIQRERSTPFAMSMAYLPDSSGLGYGRGQRFHQADAIAILDAYQRLAGFPHESRVVSDVNYAEVAEVAVDPWSVGRYVADQFTAPLSRIRPFDATTPMDWVWGHDVTNGEPRLVPAELAFYRYDYHHRLDRHGADEEGAVREHFLHESSSGCALGGSLAEAAMWSLIELAERDAFLLSWYQAMPLPRIEPASVTDPVSRLLLRMLDVHGFDVHLLVATQDIQVPVVWALAVNREQPFPATFSTAGSGVDPESAVKAALWELEQRASEPITWDRARVEPMLEDPWKVDTLEDHMYLYALPERRERVMRVLGGPSLPLEQAFPGWPAVFREGSGGDMRQALDFVVQRYADAGLTSITVVDQSTVEHRDLELVVAKAVVPGITPMCFGYAQQRFDGLPRLARAVARGPLRGAAAPFEPHPLP